jgi:hypothetical protein
MSSVRKEGKRMRQHPKDHLNDNVGYIQRRTEGKSASEIRRQMCVRMARSTGM